MMQSAWSEPESGVTMEVGLAFGGDARAAEVGGVSNAATLRRCEVPKVQPELNRSDQRVPVYWDQTVPEWRCKEAGALSAKRKARKSQGAARHGVTLPSVYIRRMPGRGASWEGKHPGVEYNKGGDGGRGRFGAAGGPGASSEVSFDAIMSMYQSSLVEKFYEWSRVWGTILKRRGRKRHDDKRRLWRNFAGSFSGLMLGEVVDEGSLRSLQEAIERTNICASSVCGSHCGMRLLKSDHAIFRGRGCDFQGQLHSRRDPLTFNSPMLATRSS